MATCVRAPRPLADTETKVKAMDGPPEHNERDPCCMLCLFVLVRERNVIASESQIAPIPCPIWCSPSPPASCWRAMFCTLGCSRQISQDVLFRRHGGSVHMAVWGDSTRGYAHFVLVLACFVSYLSASPCVASSCSLRVRLLCVPRSARSHSQQEQEETELKKVCGKVKALLSRFQVCKCIRALPDRYT